jgi:L-alanine-DL-glutamate epimerase-like enolase superfamily enzyme
MTMNRRQFGTSLASGYAAALLGCGTRGDLGDRQKSFVAEDLKDTLAKPLLRTDQLEESIPIEEILLLKKGGEHFVRVRSTSGAEGVAVTNSRAEYLYPILNRLVIPFFLGKDARRLEEHLFGVYRHASNYKLQGLALWCPVAWVEFAILDMLGRMANQPLHLFLGDKVRKEVDFYVASSRRDTTPEEEVAHLESLIEETGATAVKFRVGGRMSRNADALPGRTESLIPLARARLGDEIAIHADSNSSYDVENGIRVGQLLEEIGAVYFEEPCPFDHLEETKQVADALTIPVAGGEQESSERRFRWMIENRGVDIIQPDLHYYGGLIRSTRVARMAAVAGMPTTVHISGGFGFVYMLHFAAITPDIGRYQEYKRNVERYAPWFEGGIQIKGGRLTVPTGPGVGISNVAEILKGAEPIL